MTTRVDGDQAVEDRAPAEIEQLRELGKGGNASVHEAIASGRRVALKRPRPDVLARRKDARSLFEREYYTLAQLAHPNIVEVYGYGIDEAGPYYTMELLEGRLSEIVPLQWRQACRILRDVAAALALVHARRLVHRDVTLHNVRLSAEGRAKLMDFGAMTPIGSPARVLGTPAYMAPEAVYHQALDQRTDLYALGALAYRLMCGRDAYPARRIDQLRDTWRTRPRPLREHGAEIPEALEELIRQLLCLNPLGRPRTAGEVFVRLGAIAGLHDLDDAEVARAYLTLPALVGRERELATIRRHILQGGRARGSALLIEGAAGMGRSRLLDACILDGQLMGALVLRARAAPTSGASFDVLASLGAKLAEARPGLTPQSPRVQALLASRTGESQATTPSSPEEQVLLQHELVVWLLQAADRPLVLIVDDMHLADLDSAAVLARLVDAAPKHRLTILMSVLSGTSGLCARALRIVREQATTLTLGPLTEEQTLALVRSLFDDVLNVQLAAKRIYDVARGNPQATVDLAEWLVEGSHVVHEGGRWLIPDTLSGLPLPDSVHEALRQRLSGLGPRAIELGAAIAVADDANLPAADYAALLEGADERLAHAALAQLVAAQIVMPSGQGYNLSQTAYRGLLIELVGPQRLASIHRSIAQVCLTHGQLDWGIYHLFHGDAKGRAVDLLLSRIKEGMSPTHILSSLEERVSLLREVLDFCCLDQRPAAEIFTVKNELVRRAEIKVSLVRGEIEELSARYKELTGYVDWLLLPDSMPAAARIAEAVKIADERHRSAPEHARIMSPREALPSMVEFVSACLASATANCEIELAEQMPPLAPFAPLSDSIRLLAQYIEAAEATIGGRVDVASARFIELLDELDGDAGGKMGATANRLKRHCMIAIGMLNAGMSRSIALDYADRLEALAVETRDPYAKSTSLRVRHQYHLRRGNWRQAQHWQHEVELDKLTDRSAVFNPSGIYALSWIHAILGNAAGIRECLTQMREYSAVSEGLRTWERYMAAEYDRLRGAGEQALPQYAGILEAPAGRHMAWLYCAYGALLCHESLGRLEEGRRLGEQLLERAEAAQLSAMRGLILRPLGLIEARLGNFESAYSYLSENIEQCKKHGLGGINLGLAYEFRARAAILAGDRPEFEAYAALCVDQYQAGGGNPELSARLEALFDEARTSGVIDASDQSPDLAPMTLSHAQVELRDRLADCDTAERRSMQALLAITQAANAAGGHFFATTEHGLQLLASSGCEPASAELSSSAARYLSAALAGAERTQSVPDGSCTESDATASATATATDGGFRGEPCEGLLPQVLPASQHHTAVGVFLLRPGPTPPRVPDPELLEVVAESLLAAGDIRAAG